MSHRYFDLKEKGHRLCLEIEKLPASEQQTKISLMASGLNKLLGCSSPGCGYPDGKPCLLCGLIVDKPDALAAEQERDQLKAELVKARVELEFLAEKWRDQSTSGVNTVTERMMFRQLRSELCTVLCVILERIEKEKK